MAGDRWWNKDRPRGLWIGISVGIVAALVIGVLAAVFHSISDHDARMVHQPIDALTRVHVAGSVRHSSIASSGCGGYVPPVARRTDWSTLSPVAVEERITTQVLTDGWTTKASGRGFERDHMSMTVAVEPASHGGSRILISIAAPEFCDSDQ
jgi:hypothetical protein